MKRILALVLALVFVSALAACGLIGGSQTGEGFQVDIFWYKFDDPYTTSVRDAMTGYLDGITGLTHEHHDCENDQYKQDELIDKAISKGTDILIVNIVDTGNDAAAMGIVGKAQTAGLPVVFFNREVSDIVVGFYDRCVFVGTEPDEAGYLQGELLFEIISRDFDNYDLGGDGNIQYIMFKGQLGNLEADGRTKYSVEKANELFNEAGLGGLVYYDPESSDLFYPCDWDADKSYAVMSAVLEDFPMDGKNPIEVVLCNNDAMAEGVIDALNEVGWNLGDDPEKTIPVFGVDATEQAIELINKGKMTGTIKQDADAMAEGIVRFVKAVKDNADFLAVLDSFSNVTNKKVRIPYAKISGASL